MVRQKNREGESESESESETGGSLGETVNIQQAARERGIRRPRKMLPE